MTKEEKLERRGLARLLQTLARWRMAIIPVLLVGFVVGAVVLWKQFGAGIVASNPDRYHLSLERIHVTPPPAWVKADVRGEVFRNAGWREQSPSILEDDLSVRVAQAFEQHTWVAKVTRVTKQSQATINVELEYRRPVAMVEVDYQGQGGLLPVDAEGVLLPPEDFTAEEAITYPRITVDYSGPSGSVGTPWGDARVAGGAAIAAVLVEHWREFGLYRVVWQAAQRPATVAPPTYELHTRGRSRVLWGHAPGEEPPGEATAEQKLVRLQRYVQQHGSLQEPESETEIDLRDAEQISARPLNAAR